MPKYRMNLYYRRNLQKALIIQNIDGITSYTIILCCPCYVPKYVPRLEGIMHDPEGGVHYAF